MSLYSFEEVNTNCVFGRDQTWRYLVLNFPLQTNLEGNIIKNKEDHEIKAPSPTDPIYVKICKIVGLSRTNIEFPSKMKIIKSSFSSNVIGNLHTFKMIQPLFNFKHVCNPDTIKTQRSIICNLLINDQVLRLNKRKKYNPNENLLLQKIDEKRLRFLIYFYIVITLFN